MRLELERHLGGAAGARPNVVVVAFATLRDLEPRFPELVTFNARLAAADPEACAALGGVFRALVALVESASPRIVH